jgi:hypothetical protein
MFRYTTANVSRHYLYVITLKIHYYTQSLIKCVDWFDVKAGCDSIIHKTVKK